MEMIISPSKDSSTVLEDLFFRLRNQSPPYFIGPSYSTNGTRAGKSVMLPLALCNFDEFYLQLSRPKQCLACSFYSDNPYLRCAVNPFLDSGCVHRDGSVP